MWQEFNEQASIDELMQVFGSFHDSCLKEVAIRNREYVSSNLSMGFSNPSVVRFLFQRQFRNPTAIEVQFERVDSFNWVHFNDAHDSGFSIILQAVFIRHDDLIYWAEDIDWTLEGEDRNEYRWISAKTAKWRIVDDATGADDKLLSFA